MDMETSELEELFHKAVDHPEWREPFLRHMLEAELFVLVASPVEIDAQGRIAKDAPPLKVRAFEDGLIPVFTGTQRIFDNGAVDGSVHYIAVQARDIFNLLKGNSFILNPYSKVSKIFTPAEIESLLAGETFLASGASVN